MTDPLTAAEMTQLSFLYSTSNNMFQSYAIKNVLYKIRVRQNYLQGKAFHSDNLQETFFEHFMPIPGSVVVDGSEGFIVQLTPVDSTQIRVTLSHRS